MIMTVTEQHKIMEHGYLYQFLGSATPNDPSATDVADNFWYTVSPGMITLVIAQGGG